MPGQFIRTLPCKIGAIFTRILWEELGMVHPYRELAVGDLTLQVVARLGYHYLERRQLALASIFGVLVLDDLLAAVLHGNQFI